jgi:hypothetical protein
MAFNRRVIEPHLEDPKSPLRLAYAVPDHPWVDASDGAAVRIAMTVGAKGDGDGVLACVTEEKDTDGRERFVSLAESSGVIHADLRQGTDITRVTPLRANDALSVKGIAPHGAGFLVTPDEAASLGLGRVPGLERHIRPYRNGRDLADRPRGVMVIDLFGLAAEEVRDKYPEVYQWMYTRVKPERDQNRRESRKKHWWLFGEPLSTFRPALAGLSRYIATIRVAKHHFFVFLPGVILPDSALVAFATADAYHLGVLSSRVHVCWSLAAAGRLGVGNDPYYNNTLCFSPFPFPDAAPEQQTRIRDLGEKLDAHRKSRQALHPALTMTGMYNALEALRQGRELTVKEKSDHERGLATVLRELHDELDAAVAEAYGWPADLSDEEILSRLAALNAERAAEEKQGKIRWLRPDYQTKSRAERRKEQATLDYDLPPTPAPAAKDKKGKGAKAKDEPKLAGPAGIREQTQAVRVVADALLKSGVAITPEAVAERFARAPRAKVQEILQAMETLGLM